MGAVAKGGEVVAEVWGRGAVGGEGVGWWAGGIIQQRHIQQRHACLE